MKLIDSCKLQCKYIYTVEKHTNAYKRQTIASMMDNIFKLILFLSRVRWKYIYLSCVYRPRILSTIFLEKSEKHKNSYFLMSVVSLYTQFFVMFCVFLYGPFCHGAHKLGLSTLFTTFFSSNISSIYIITFYNPLNLIRIRTVTTTRTTHLK